MTAVVRKSLPLEAVDVSKLEDLRCNPALLAELSVLSGSDLNQSVAEAQLLRALVLAGLRSVEERVMDAGYAEIALELDLAAKQKMARRRSPTWAAE